jgi:SH3-like domain-containing protein
MNDQNKYEMCLKVAKTMLNYAKLQKSNGNEGWRQSVSEGKRMAEMAVSIKRELDADKTAEINMAA